MFGLLTVVKRELNKYDRESLEKGGNTCHQLPLIRIAISLPIPTRGQIESLNDKKHWTSIMKNWTFICKIGPLLGCIWPFGVFFPIPNQPIRQTKSTDQR